MTANDRLRPIDPDPDCAHCSGTGIVIDMGHIPPHPPYPSIVCPACSGACEACGGYGTDPGEGNPVYPATPCAGRVCDCRPGEFEEYVLDTCPACQGRGAT